MAFVATPQGVEVVLKATQNSIPVVNVFHVDAGGAVSESVLTDILAVFAAWIVDFWLPQLHNSYVLNEFVATDISVVDGLQSSIVLTSANQGEITSAPAAGNAACVASFRTGYTGRSFRGRSYVGALANASLLNAQYMNVADQANIGTIFVELIDALQTAGFILSVLSKIADGVARVAGLLTEIAYVIVDQKVDSQRRRTAN